MPETQRDVVITGLGPVTSIGLGCDALWESLKSARSNVERRSLTVDLGKTVELPMAGMEPTLPDSASSESRAVGASKASPGVPSADLDRHFSYLSEQGCDAYRDLAYALRAIDLAFTDARLDFDRSQNAVGMVQAFEAPGVERTAARLFQLFSHGPPQDGPPPVYDLLAPSFYNMQAFLYVHVVAKAFGLRGFCTSVHNACSSGAYAIEVAAQHIRSGQAEVMVVVGAESFETAVRLEWFRRLDLYAKSGDSMRPFASDSTGFYVGEGGAAMVLESADHARRRGATPYARYVGGAFAHQAWKQTMPDIRSAKLRDVITESLRRTGVDAASIDLVVPHGAGTQLSDGYEAACLREALGGRAKNAVAAVYKPSVGHMLAASGLIDTVCALMAMKHQCVPATVHATGSQTSLPMPLADKFMDRRIATLLKLSTGFTGHDAALVFRLP